MTNGILCCIIKAEWKIYSFGYHFYSYNITPHRKEKKSMGEKIVYLSLKPNPEILGLFSRIKALEPPGLGYAEVYERASQFFVTNHDRININALLNELKKAPITYNEALPLSFKVRQNDPDCDAQINSLLAQKFHIKRILTPFKLRVVLYPYLLHLEGKIHLEEGTETMTNNDEVSLNSLKLEAVKLILEVSDKDTMEEVLEAIEEVI